MHSLQHVLQRGALALALLSAGIGSGYGLYQPQTTPAEPCHTAQIVSGPALADPGYRLLPARASSSRNSAHAACSCGRA